MSWIKNGMLVWIMDLEHEIAKPGVVKSHNDSLFTPTADVSTFVYPGDKDPGTVEYPQSELAPTAEDAFRRMLGKFESSIRSNTAAWTLNHYDWYSKAEQKAKAKTRKQPK